MDPGRGTGPAAEVEVFAPARADLAGGTLDLWPLYCFHPGAVVVSAALGEGVRLRARLGGRPGAVLLRNLEGEAVELGRDQQPRHLVAAVAFALLPQGGVEVEVLEQLPVGSGLGGSSVLAVALARACLALTGRRPGLSRLVALLKDLEAGVLGAPSGCQDYYPALRGGTLAVHLAPGGEVVQRLPGHRWVEERLVVVDTGVRHHSGLVNWEVFRRRVEGDGQTTSALAAVAEAARRCCSAVVAQEERAVGQAIAAEWQARRRLAPEVATPALEAVLEAGMAAGAMAGKACGAGGGGSVVFWSAPTHREAVAAAALRATGPAGRRVVTAPRRPFLNPAAAVAYLGGEELEPEEKRRR